MMSFTLVFWFLLVANVISTPIPGPIREIPFDKRVTSARDVYDALKKLDSDITAVLPQIDMISNTSTTEQAKSVVCILTSAIRYIRPHTGTHGPLAFKSPRAPSKLTIITLAQNIISKICKASLKSFTVTSFSSLGYHDVRRMEDEEMRNGVQHPVTAIDWALLIPRLLWNILDTVMMLLGRVVLT